MARFSIPGNSFLSFKTYLVPSNVTFLIVMDILITLCLIIYFSAQSLKSQSKIGN